MTWHNLNDKQRKRVLDALRSSKGDSPASPEDLAIAKEIEDYAKPGPDDQAYRDAADGAFTDGPNVDADAPVSVSDDDGAWVLAWVWVSDSDAGIDRYAEDEDEAEEVESAFD